MNHVDDKDFLCLMLSRNPFIFGVDICCLCLSLLTDFFKGSKFIYFWLEAVFSIFFCIVENKAFLQFYVNMIILKQFFISPAEYTDVIPKAILLEISQYSSKIEPAKSV